MMKKKNSLKVLAAAALLAMVMPAYTAAPHWMILRSVASGLRTMNHQVNTLIPELQGAIDTFGLETLIGYTTPFAYPYATDKYLRLRAGSFLVKSDLLPGKQLTFSYCLSMCGDTAGTNNKLKFYFNNLTNYHNPGIFCVIDASAFGVSTGMSEIYYYTDGTMPAIKISCVSSSANMRCKVRKNGSDIEVTAFVRFTSTSPAYTGYHTLAFIAGAEAPHYCTAMMGAQSTCALSNNGLTWTGNVATWGGVSAMLNYGYFHVESGVGTFDADGGGLPAANSELYPATADVDQLFTDAQADAAFFTNEDAIDTMTINVGDKSDANYPSGS